MEAFRVFSPLPLLPFQAYAPRDSDPCRMKSGVQDLITNEIMRRLVLHLPQMPGDQQERQDNNGMFISGGLGHVESGWKKGLEGLS